MILKIYNNYVFILDMEDTINFIISEDYYCHMFFKKTKYMKFHDFEKSLKPLVFLNVWKTIISTYF